MLYSHRGGRPDSCGPADCAVLPTSSSWFGMTYPGDKPMVVEGINKLIQQGVYPEKLN